MTETVHAHQTLSCLLLQATFPPPLLPGYEVTHGCAMKEGCVWCFARKEEGEENVYTTATFGCHVIFH